MTSPSDSRTFRDRLVGGDAMLGTFVKMPTTQAIEILGSLGFDFVVIDQEHAPLDRTQIDLMCFAARASGMAPVVRVGDPGAANVLSALDCGAQGIMFPHVTSAETAQNFVARCRYQGGARGFAGMSRAAEWGRVPGPEHIARQDSEIAVIAMIEDQSAIAEVPAIVATEGVDAVFIGRGDLTASFGQDPEAKTKVAGLTEKIASATRAGGTTLMMLATSPTDAETMRGLGATAMLVASDHNFLRSAAAAAFRDFSAKG
jgi:staphyloferrin B biosynthesis citrate synthase